MCGKVPRYLLSIYISTKTHNHEPLAGVRPGCWRDRNGHGADKPGGNMEGGGSDVAGKMGGVGGCARWVLRVGLVWPRPRASLAGAYRRHCMIPVIAGPSR